MPLLCALHVVCLICSICLQMLSKVLNLFFHSLTVVFCLAVKWPYCFVF